MVIQGHLPKTYLLTSWLSDKSVLGTLKLHKRSSTPSKTRPQTVHIHSFKLMQFKVAMPVGRHCWWWCFMLLPRRVLTTSIPAQSPWFRGCKGYKGLKGLRVVKVLRELKVLRGVRA